MIETFLAQFTSWAESQPGIKSVALVGSYARGQAKPDSDVDLVILADDPVSFIVDPAWALQFGIVEKQQTEDWGKVTSLRVWYQDSMEVEFGFCATDWADRPLDEGTRQVIAGGIRVLYDPQGLLILD